MTISQKETLRDLLYKYWSELDSNETKLKNYCMMLIIQVESDLDILL